MTAPVQDNQSPIQEKPSDKELNFRQLEAKYQRQLEQERAARLDAEKTAQEAIAKRQTQDDDDDDSDPYIDKKRLAKTLNKFGQQSKQETQSAIQHAVGVALQEERKQTWMKNNPDFYDVLKHADKFADKDPELAETILQMPEGFERQKLVYKSIKNLGLHKPEEKQPSIQEKIDANRKSPYYQPSGVGNAPYASSADFSSSGQKQAYAKMKELQARLHG